MRAAVLPAVDAPGCAPGTAVAIVTGGCGGVGSAIVAALRRLEGGGPEVTVLDLPEFDVGDLGAWHALEGRYDAAFLNAGIGIGVANVAETGRAWAVQPNRVEPFRFPGVPGRRCGSAD